jgi:polysaccharide export outer membrane protein
MKNLVRRFSALCVIIGLALSLPLSGAVERLNNVRGLERVYRLSPFDKVSILVYGEPDLSSVQLISDDGMAFVPLVGALPLGGKTIAEASRAVESAFINQEYLRKPAVTISIEAFAPKIVTVLGEVEKPGSVEIPPGRNGLPIQITIAGAGGFTGIAKTTDVNVTRSVVGGGQNSSVVVNVDKILKSNRNTNKGGEFMVYPDDVVYVPRRVF